MAKSVSSYLAESGLEDHLLEVLVRVLESKPSDPLAAFDAVSRIIASEQKAGNSSDGGGGSSDSRAIPATNVNPYSLPSKAYRQTKFNRNVDPELDVAHAGAVSELVFPKPNQAAAEEGAAAEYVPLNAEFEAQNTTDDLKALGQFGVVFSPEQAYELGFAIKRLCESQPLKSARFWGVVKGTQKDYIVVETVFQDGQRGGKSKDGEDAEEQDAAAPEGELSEEDLQEARLKKEQEVKRTPMELRIPAEVESGANQFVYFVTNAIGEPWSRLPDLVPSQILAARNVKRFLTGNLAEVVMWNPVFPGTEANLLRAQIARISAGTLVAPAGLFALSGDDEEAEEGFDPAKRGKGPLKSLREKEANAEFAVVGHEILGRLDGWVHSEPCLSTQQGRSTLWLAPELAKMDQEYEEQKDNEDGPKPVRREPGPAETEDVPRQLSVLAKDGPLFEATGFYNVPAHAWSVRASRSGAFAVRSNRWPGAVAVCYPIGKGPEPEQDEDAKVKKERPTRYRLVNVYVGHGLKTEALERQEKPVFGAPQPLGPIQDEYHVSSDSKEKPLPTREQLSQFLPPPPPKPVEEVPEESQEDGQGAGDAEGDAEPDADE
eukprot:ANDGO_04115.mRNA.1 Flagellar radial spoke protein 4